MPVPDVASPLSPNAINGAVERLKELQEAIKNPPPGFKVVKEFNKKTYETAVKAQSVDVGFPDIRKAGDDLQNGNLAKPKTSYLGAAVLQTELYKAAGISARQDSPTALRNEEGLKSIADEAAKQLEPLQAKLESRQRHLQKVESGGIGGLIARVRYGSADSLRDKVAASQDLVNKQEQKIDQIMQQASPELAAQIGPKLGRPEGSLQPQVEMNAPQVGEQGPGEIELDESQSLNESQEVDHSQDLDRSQEVDQSPELNESQEVDHSQDLDRSQEVDQAPKLNESQEVDHSQDLDRSQEVDQAPKLNESQEQSPALHPKQIAKEKVRDLIRGARADKLNSDVSVVPKVDGEKKAEDHSLRSSFKRGSQEGGGSAGHGV